MDLIKSMKSVSILKVTGKKNTYCTDEIYGEVAKRADNLETIHLELSKDSSLKSFGMIKLSYLPCTIGKRFYGSTGGSVFLFVCNQQNSELWDSYDFPNMPGLERCQVPHR